MHLLLAERGSITEGEEAVDLGQTPGDVLFLSAADTELASLANILRERAGAASWRLANLASLKHPMSVDQWIGKTASRARLVIVRALGGISYFSYLIEALFAAHRQHGFQLAILPGDDKADPALEPWSSLPSVDRDWLLSYLTQGGERNMGRFADLAEALLTGGERPEPAEPLLKSGIWWPGSGSLGVAEWSGRHMVAMQPVVAVIFYRALVQSGQTEPVAALIDALEAQGNSVLPLYVSSLKDDICIQTLRHVFGHHPPDVVLNATSFAVAAPGADGKATVLDEGGAVVLQVVFSSSTEQTWQASSQGFSARDLAMNVALPEVDGRILSRAVSFKSAALYDANVQTNIVVHQPQAGRVAFVARLASGWARLRRKQNGEKNIALILANYPNRDGRLGNGVGLDTPAATIEVLSALKTQGYLTGELPADGNGLMDHMMAGPTNSATEGRTIREVLSLHDYKTFFASLPIRIQEDVTARWGPPEQDPFHVDGTFALPLARFGKILIGIQPARGYNIDPKQSYHAPDLVPPHGYFAFYAFLRTEFAVDAVVHMGKHGNLEWLPGKAMALSENCYPEAVLGPVPHLYPFIVNDPGEGTQAKRRAAAVIIDHLTPPLTRAESYGPLKDLEALVDEYYQAQGSDPRRVKILSKQILDLTIDTGIDKDAGIESQDEDQALVKLDAWLCDLKESQIRDGLHIFGKSPEGRLLTDLTAALARIPRGTGEGRDQSLQRTLAEDALGLDRATFDPLDCEMAKSWTGPRPRLLEAVSSDPWRSCGDTVERIELLATAIINGQTGLPTDWHRSAAVLAEIRERLQPSLEACGEAEIGALMTGLAGRFVMPGSSGAPTRGRPDVLPTGKNFYSVDSRAVPTPTAWELGRKSAELLIARYVQDHGEWPTSFGITAWGTSNMRTGGDDIAQALALIGVKPVWDMASRRVTGFEIIPMAKLDRPRVDVTLRISGFFRDAFPEQIALFDKAVRAVGKLEEDDADNPVGERMRRDFAQFSAEGLDEKTATRRACYRVFGSKPGAYGAGLQALIDEKGWERRADLAESYLVWGGYAYGAEEEGRAERGLFEERLRSVQAVVQNQDNREHDLLDSDDYYQFEGGMTAAVEHLSGERPAIYHNDHSRPEKPVIRSLEQEISRVVRSRVVNPKWIAGVMRHGYKGAFEITATVDYMFAFAATTGAVRDHHFEAAYQAFIMDDKVRGFMLDNNAPALKELAERFIEAVDRGLWSPKSNSARFGLEDLL